ncbi:acyl--CoA ligase family protein [Leekyejoonella antrihumi]|uniref:acyl--CoA ligase family protein n=1 Tax=Leekyejoonella antrihumi TaxID=1660198 RepID=UPI001FE67BE6|nr:acyl--CoA ligase family protein [Leekyejoonella antrihumi]
MLQIFESLSPVHFLDRSARVFAHRTAIIDGLQRFTYAEFAKRSEALTGLLAARGILPGDRVAALCTNSHTMLELHQGVPMRGAVLVPLNIRLSEGELHYVLEHSGATVLVATGEFSALAARLGELAKIPVIHAETREYEAELAQSEPARLPVEDERSMIAINYTSGTTGRPKGVMYHHRGAYLQALAMAYHVNLRPDSQYLWTLPMFHCNGWCFPWAVTASGGTHICLRAVDPGEIWQRLREGVTHLSAAPTVLTMIAEHPQARGERLPRAVEVSTGGAPPTPTILRRMDALNMHVTHLYGLTETFGPAVVNEWQPEWNSLSETEVAELKARQGVANVIASPTRVVDLSGRDVPADGITIGELVMQGNDLMLGYYRDQEATDAAEIDGWFRTGDLSVMHPDGYVEVRDRLKDVIISGGENIASLEIERVLDSHPAVVESAVVSAPDEHWGEIPIAYVTVRSGQRVTAAELTDFVRSKIATFKAPRQVIFGPLPRTSTGKIQKNVLRRRIRNE